MMSFASAVDTWALLAVAATWQLAALALVAWVCERAFRLRQGRVRYVLWWCVLVAPLVMTPGRMALQQRHAMISVRAPQAAVKMVTQHVMILPPSDQQTAAPKPPISPAGRVVSPRPTLRPADLLGIAWLLGCTALALRLEIGHRRVRRLLAESLLPKTAGPQETLTALAAQAGVRHEVALRVSEAIGSPVLYGWRRPTVLVPKGWLESLAGDELRAMLAHEVAHVRRQDFLANGIQRLIAMPLFFHPGAWLASRRIAQAREELCDAWALGLGTDAASYARSLAAAAERAQFGLTPVSLGIAEGRSTLWRRVEAIMRMGSARAISRPLLIAVIAIGLISAGVFAAVQLGGESPGPSAQFDAQSDEIAALGEIERDVKELALALLMYVQDSGGQFPQTQDMGQIMELLAPYLASQKAFAYAIRYVLPAGLRVGAIEVPAVTPTMIVEDHPKYVVIAYADGHVDDQEKETIPPDELPENQKRIVEFTVVHENDGPAAGAHIELVGGGGEPVVTDGRGFRRVVVERPLAEAAFYIRSADGREDALPAIFFTGPLTAEKAVLHPRGSVADTVQFSGRVVDSAGRPVAGADLWVKGFGGRDPSEQDTFLSRELGETDANGRFSVTIPRLPKGNQYFVSGWLRPWICVIIAHKPGYGVGWARRDGDSAVTGAEISLGHSAGLRGRIRDAEGKLLSQVTVQLSEIATPAAADSSPSRSLVLADISVPRWAETRTDKEGRFSFADLPAGGSAKLGITTCGAGACYRADEMAPDLGEIKLTKQGAELTVKLVHRPIIEGMLLAPGRERKPASRVKVMLEGPIKGQPHSNLGDSTITDEKGHYRFTLADAGTWTLWVADTRFSAVLARNLKVDLGQHVTISTTVLQTNAIIRGRVLDATTGAPVPNVHVMCNSTEPSAPEGPPTTETGATTGLDGSFEVGGPPGKDMLSLGGPPERYTWSHTVQKVESGGKVRVSVTESPDKPSMRLLTVRSGQTLTGVDLFVTREAQMSGVVLGPDGRPWQPKSSERGGYVHGHLDHQVVTSETYPPLGTRVESDGSFSIRYCYPGVPAVFLVADEEDGLGGAARITPELGAPTRVTIRMSPMATVTGRVVMPDGTPAATASVGIAGMIGGRTDEAGRFLLKRGVVGLPMSVNAYLPASPRDGNGTSWPKYRGESNTFEVRPGEKTVDVGDIVLKRWEGSKTK